MFKAGADEPAATGWFVHVFVDRATRRPVAVPGAAARRAGAAGVSARETIFTLEATPVKFGPGAADDAGWELARLGVTRALLVTDPGVAAAGHPERVRAAIAAAGIDVVVFDGARVEPTLDSLEAAAAFARDAGVDGFVSVGGGSAIDTAKVADLVVSHPAPVMDVRQPAGRRGPQAARRRCAPHLAIPTTSGTGSEATTVAVLDIPELRLKTGISHRYLRPAQAIVDPELARTLGPEVTASAGLDVVCHAAESLPLAPVRRAPAAGVAGRPAAVPGREPGRRRVVGARRSSTAAASCAARWPTPTTSRRAAR